MARRCYTITLPLRLTVEAESLSHARPDLRELYLHASDTLPPGAGVFVTNAEWKAIMDGLEPTPLTGEATPARIPGDGPATPAQQPTATPAQEPTND